MYRGQLSETFLKDMDMNLYLYHFHPFLYLATLKGKCGNWSSTCLMEPEGAP